MQDLLAILARQWADLVGQVDGPMMFRLILQPLVAALLAMCAGVKDARAGCPPYFWAMYADPVQRRKLLREGWKDVGRVFVIAVIIDVICQIIALRWVYPAQALIVTAILALLPSLLCRGVTNRIVRRWHRGAIGKQRRVPVRIWGRVLRVADAGRTVCAHACPEVAERSALRPLLPPMVRFVYDVRSQRPVDQHDRRMVCTEDNASYHGRSPGCCWR
jgi:hypothetical protein